MQSTSDTDELFADLFERSEIVAELDGPQIEAWVSGLFPMFATDEAPRQSTSAFIAYCVDRGGPVAALLCRAVLELSGGQVADTAQHAVSELEAVMPPSAAEIGASEAVAAWTVTAPFGRSIVVGFEVPVVGVPVVGEGERDTRHSMLVEVGSDDEIVDLQLAGPPQALLDEAAAADDRVAVAALHPEEAMTLISDAWPAAGRSASSFGPGMYANEHFVRRRVAQATGQVLAVLDTTVRSVDIRRGLNDDEFGAANRAALSTLRSALGDIADHAEQSATRDLWVSIIRGDVADVSPRERDGLLWLEWADWLGAGLGLLRSEADALVTGEILVDYVNRCPEVSSTIAKADRDYVAWAFDVAIELLEDAEVLSAGRLTEDGAAELAPAMVAAWSTDAV